MATKMRNFQEFCGTAALAVALTGPAGLAAAAPSAGDTYTYRHVNGYNKEVRGQIQLRVTSADPAGVTYSAMPDNAMAGWQHTVVLTPEGNWLRQLVENHGEKIEYAFATAYPAYVFPLEAGKTWSLRVNATVPGAYRNASRSVRVDGKVLGTERIRVPAGEFDTIRIRRLVYPGDTDFMLGETRITETDWYAPALGRPVRTERRSAWIDQNLCGQFPPCESHGDWDIYELVGVRAAKG